MPRFLLMSEFGYNNIKNTNIGHISFELNRDYYLQASYKKDINFCFQLKSANKLANKVKKLMVIYKKNLQHIQKL